MKRSLCGAGALMLVVLGCQKTTEAPPTQQPAKQEAPDPFKAEAIALIQKTQAALKTELTEAITADGHAGAIDACADGAPAIAMDMSSEAMRIRRIGMAVRNQKTNAPTAAQKAILEKMTQEKPDYLGVVDGKKTYMRGIFVTNAICLKCHGDATALAEGVQERLKENYPGDQATGHKPGDLRGAFVVEKI